MHHQNLHHDQIQQSRCLYPNIPNATSYVLQQAQIFAKSYHSRYNLPSNLSTSVNYQLDQKIAQQKQKVKKVIMVSRHQHKLYKTLQANDQIKRLSYKNTINQKINHQQNNIKQRDKSHIHKFQIITKHKKQVYRNFAQQQRKMREKARQQAKRLKNIQQQFYKMQNKQKQIAYQRQRKSQTLYHIALKRLDKIHYENIQYSKNSQRQLNLNLSRNNLKPQLMRKKSQESLNSNQSKKNILQKGNQIRRSKHNFYLTNYQKNMENSKKALEHKQVQNKKSSKRIQKFLSDRTKKWKQTKSRIDEQLKQSSPKCQSILNRSTSGNSSHSLKSLSRSYSRAHQNNKVWEKRMQKYKQSRQNDKKNKDLRLDIKLKHHFDVKLKTSTSIKINEKFNSISNRAKILSGFDNYQEL